MPELPEVRTVAKTLKKSILNKKITNIKIIYPKIIEPDSLNINQLIGKEIKDINTYGKYLIFKFDDVYLISHLRMEGKYFIKTKDEEIEKHEHIIFEMDNISLRYHDTRKFGRMCLVKNINSYKGINNLGLEPFDSKLDYNYLLRLFKNKNIPIKEALLDQSIIAGLGNIYANEVLFKSNINPLKKCSDLTKEDCNNIILSSKSILEKAIEYGGTTIKSYTSSLGVIGKYQDFLNVHKKDGIPCTNCQTPINKIKIGGRSTYYCPKCQK